MTLHADALGFFCSIMNRFSMSAKIVERPASHGLDVAASSLAQCLDRSAGIIGLGVAEVSMQINGDLGRPPAVLFPNTLSPDDLFCFVDAKGHIDGQECLDSPAGATSR
jgi:hypothetical protein